MILHFLDMLVVILWYITRISMADSGVRMEDGGIVDRQGERTGYGTGKDVLRRRYIPLMIPSGDERMALPNVGLANKNVGMVNRNVGLTNRNVGMVNKNVGLANKNVGMVNKNVGHALPSTGKNKMNDTGIRTTNVKQILPRTSNEEVPNVRQALPNVKQTSSRTGQTSSGTGQTLPNVKQTIPRTKQPPTAKPTAKAPYYRRTTITNTKKDMDQHTAAGSTDTATDDVPDTRVKDAIPIFRWADVARDTSTARLSFTNAHGTQVVDLSISSPDHQTASIHILRTPHELTCEFACSFHNRTFRIDRQHGFISHRYAMHARLLNDTISKLNEDWHGSVHTSIGPGSSHNWQIRHTDGVSTFEPRIFYDRNRKEFIFFVRSKISPGPHSRAGSGLSMRRAARLDSDICNVFLGLRDVVGGKEADVLERICQFIRDSNGFLGIRRMTIGSGPVRKRRSTFSDARAVQDGTNRDGVLAKRMRTRSEHVQAGTNRDGVMVRTSRDGVQARTSRDGVMVRTNRDGVMARKSANAVQARTIRDGVMARKNANAILAKRMRTRPEHVQANKSTNDVQAKKSTNAMLVRPGSIPRVKRNAVLARPGKDNVQAKRIRTMSEHALVRPGNMYVQTRPAKDDKQTNLSNRQTRPEHQQTRPVNDMHAVQTMPVSIPSDNHVHAMQPHTDHINDHVNDHIDGMPSQQSKGETGRDGGTDHGRQSSVNDHGSETGRDGAVDSIGSGTPMIRPLTGTDMSNRRYANRIKHWFITRRDCCTRYCYHTVYCPYCLHHSHRRHRSCHRRGSYSRGDTPTVHGRHAMTSGVIGRVIGVMIIACVPVLYISMAIR